MSYQLSRFDVERDSAEWDALCALAPMSTLLHTRKFLSYHGDRFQDESRVVRSEQGKLIAVFPAACTPGNSETVTSHPGASFGGLIHAGDLIGEANLQVLALIAKDLMTSGFNLLRYKAVPHIYHHSPSSDDLYALWRLGALKTRCDLSSTIDLAARRARNSRRRRALAKAQDAHIRIHEGKEHLDAFWPVLCETLASRHDARPVHSLIEIHELMTRFPDEMTLVTAHIANELVAGVLLFESARVSHAQYIAASANGRTHCALDAIFEHCFSRATTRGARFFDFGISNEDEGRTLNAGLYQYKSEFGGGGVSFDQYSLALDDALTQRCDDILGSV